MSPPEPRHPVPIRPVTIAFPSDLPRHWLAGSAMETHFFNGLNLVFPDGERFFIQAVRDHLPAVSDPALRRQVQGFFGQEARHAHEHERYFECLEQQGYRVQGFLARFRRFSQWMTRRLPAALRLSMTAGAEHWTACFGAIALRDPLLDSAPEPMRRLLLWHAAEEVEHKAVAFDLLRATHPSHALRLLGFALATLALFGWAMTATRMLLRQDGFGRREIAAARRAALARRDPALERELRRRVRAYLRRDFHPDEEADLPLAQRRLAELGLAAA